MRTLRHTRLHPRCAPLRRIGALSAVLLASSVALLSAPVASADDLPGYWYYTQTGAQQANQDGVRGQGVTIAVFDTVYDPSVPELAQATITSSPLTYCHDADDNPLEPTGTGMGTYHGTEILSMIAGDGVGTDGQPGITGVAPGAQILHYVTGSSSFTPMVLDCLGGDLSTKEGNDVAGQMVRDAVDSGADIISIAGGLISANAVDEAFAYAIAHGVIIVSGAANLAAADLGVYTNGAVTVVRSDAAGTVSPLADTGQPLVSDAITVVSPGTGIYHHAFDEYWDDYPQHYITNDAGNSAATSITSGFLALVMSKWPEATGNQILQSLIHNTGDSPNHEPATDPNNISGYGLINLNNMLAVDPTTYPDINPLIVEGYDRLPLASDIKAAMEQASQQATATVTASASPNETPSPAPTTTAETQPTPEANAREAAPGGISASLIAIIAVAAVLIIVAGAILIARHRQRRNHGR